MNTPHLFLNLIPESLVASMLTPEAYGSYMAVGIQGKSRRQAMFFEVDPSLATNVFPIEAAFERCRQESTDHVPTATASLADFMIYFNVTLLNPLVLVGCFLGAMVAFLFCGFTIQAAGRAAGKMVEEVRRQFRECKGILEGTTEPDYARCVEISTVGAQHEMIVPSCIAIATPVVTGLAFGVAGVIGLLIGGLSTGFVLAVFLANSGGAWDNAKKFIKEGHQGGKGPQAHKAAVIGDTVGDPFKDTSGPSLNILIKLMSIVAIVVAAITVRFSLL